MILYNKKAINKILNNLNINIEQFYTGYDMFDLWEEYLSGKSNAFTEILTSSLSKKQLMVIRKSFDDNAEFHSLVVKYLFAMELLIKEAINPTTMKRNEILNLSVTSSLDKIYFVLVKALNSAE